MILALAPLVFFFIDRVLALLDSAMQTQKTATGKGDLCYVNL